MARNPGAALSIAARRFRSQLLSGAPARDPIAVAERVLAIQAQDPRAARLAVRARSSGCSAADVDRALVQRALVITWLNRGTLHLVRSEDYHWLHALTTPPLFTANARRLAQEGVAPAEAERAVGLIERCIDSEGPLTRLELRDRLRRAGIRTEGQALVHLLMLAALRGAIVRGPIVEGRHAYVLVRDWIGTGGPIERERALGELARRYLAGHAPADERDLAKWAGLPLRDARAAFAAIAPRLTRSRDGLCELRRPRRSAELPRARLLGAFEPVLLGWSSREFVLQGRRQEIVSGGMFRPFALVGGRAGAIWTIRDGSIRIEPFEGLGNRELAELRADGEDVIRYLGG